MGRRDKGSLFHKADLLQGELERLAERRERQAARVVGAFEVDLLALVTDKPLWLVRLVIKSLAEDPKHAQLCAALGDAVAQRELVEGRGLVAGVDLGADDEHERPTEPPPPPAFLRSDPPLPWNPPAPDYTAEPPLVVAHDYLGTDPPAPGTYRYPEPGEPARTLPDGTVVALE